MRYRLIAALLVGIVAASVKPSPAVELKLLRTFKVGHGSEDQFPSVAISPNGKTVAVAINETVQLLDVSTGKQTFRLKIGKSNFSGVLFSPDGKTLASGGDSFRLWDVTTGKCTATMKGHNGGIGPLAFSPNGKTLASGGEDQTVRLWNVATGKNFSTINVKSKTGWKKPRVEFCSLAFNTNGKVVALGWLDGIVGGFPGGGSPLITIWSVPSGKEIDTIRGGWGFWASVAFSPNGKFLAAGFDERIILWNVASHRITVKLPTYRVRPQIVPIAISPDAKTLTTGYGSGIRLWDVASEKVVATSTAPKKSKKRSFVHKMTTSLATSNDGTLIVSGHQYGEVRIWRLRVKAKK